MEGEGELGLGELGGLGMGSGASIGDVANGGAMGATGETGVGGIGADPSSGSGSAAAIAGGDAISGNASFGGQLADQNVGDFVGSGVTSGNADFATYGGQYAGGVPGGVADYGAAGPTGLGYGEHAGISPGAFDSALGALAVAALTATGDPTGFSGTNQGIASGVGVSTNIGSPTGFANSNTETGRGGGVNVDFADGSSGIVGVNAASYGSTAGVPAESFGGTSPSGLAGLPGGFGGQQGEFSEFTEAAPGVTAANNGAVSTAALDAFGGLAIGPSPGTASGVQSTLADGPAPAVEPASSVAGTGSAPGAGPAGGLQVAGGQAAQDEDSGASTAPAGGKGATIEEAVRSGGDPGFGTSGPTEHFGGNNETSAAQNGFGDFGSGINGQEGAALTAGYTVSQAAQADPAASAILGEVFGSGLWPQFSPHKNNPYWKFNF